MSLGAATGVGITGDQTAPFTWRVVFDVSGSPGSSRRNWLSKVSTAGEASSVNLNYGAVARCLTDLPHNLTDYARFTSDLKPPIPDPTGCLNFVGRMQPPFVRRVPHPSTRFDQSIKLPHSILQQNARSLPVVSS